MGCIVVLRALVLMFDSNNRWYSFTLKARILCSSEKVAIGMLVVPITYYFPDWRSQCIWCWGSLCSVGGSHSQTVHRDRCYCPGVTCPLLLRRNISSRCHSSSY